MVVNQTQSILALIEDNREQLEEICRRFFVRRLEVFGSAVDGTFDVDRSDLDFLVEFERPPGTNAFHQYFDFRSALASLFKRDIDLVSAIAMRNPYFIRAVNASRKLVYAA
jgi:predicted nucleotidyltransferase